MCSAYLNNTDLPRSVSIPVSDSHCWSCNKQTECWLYFPCLLIGLTENADINWACREGQKKQRKSGKEMEVAREGGLEGKTNAGMRRDGLLNKTETSLLVKDFSVLVHSCSPTPQHQWEEKAICLMSFRPTQCTKKLHCGSENNLRLKGKKKKNNFYSYSQCQILHCDSVLPQYTRLFKSRSHSPVTVQQQNM